MNQDEKFMCFAWISKTKCNALGKKNCNNCSFYKDTDKAPGYDKYISKKDLKERGENICQLVKK